MTLMSPLDLLDVSSREQDVIRCLVRQPRLTLQEIATCTHIPLEELEGVITRMVQDARLNQDRENKFQVCIQSPQRKPERSSGLLDDLFS